MREKFKNFVCYMNVKIQRNWVLATTSDFIITIPLQLDVVDL